MASRGASLILNVQKDSMRHAGDIDLAAALSWRPTMNQPAFSLSAVCGPRRRGMPDIAY